MKCENCNGTGRTESPNYPGYLECLYCDGTGVVEPLTNEQWFCSLPTGEKADFLANMVSEAIEVHDKHGATWHESVIWWDGWLKEKREESV